MRIALDAMGSDTHPLPEAAGAIMAAREFGDTILLVGDQPQIQAQLEMHGAAGLPLEIVHAAEAVTMTDTPSVAGKHKPNSSMHVGMNLVKDGRADGFVTMGNTGAAMTIATLYTLRRIPGVKRPALAATVRIGRHNIMLLDVGANTDAKAEWMAQFAVMGKIYSEKVNGKRNPRIALLSNGEEEGKGNQTVLDASARFQTLPVNYIGHVEPKEVFQGTADVVVCDGFIGNVTGKTFEASISILGDLIRDELKRDVFSMLGGLIARPALRRVREQFNLGGAPLLGVNGVVIVGHGRSDAQAIKNAIAQARRAIEGRVVDLIREGLEASPG